MRNILFITLVICCALNTLSIAWTDVQLAIYWRRHGSSVDLFWVIVLAILCIMFGGLTYAFISNTHRFI